MSTASRFVGLLLFGVLCGCERSNVPSATQPAPSEKTTPAKPDMPHSSTVTGTILETMNSGGYTYVHIQTNSRMMWAAGPQTKVAVGDKVRLVGGSTMRNFHSKTLNRTFESILFVGQILSEGEVGEAPILPLPHPSTRQASSPKHASRKADIEPGSITKLDGGFTVAELYAGKKDLNGQKIVIRGRVVKFTPNIMGKHWVHIQDGTGAAESYDLTVTTKDRVKVGDTVVVTGTLTADKNLGSGYFYPILIEEAAITGAEAPSSSPHQ